MEVDDFNGEELLAAVDPWLLASAELCVSIAAAALTGLRVGMVADVRYAESTRILRELGELPAHAIPEFRTIVPERPVHVYARDGDSDSVGRDDDLRYDGWHGDDFSYSSYGPVLSERALEVVKMHRVRGCQLWPISPGLRLDTET
ncbi:MAG: hypothetical protein M3N29_03665 [Chloroflexota bacterium]|nr:hypothetical protein [Chloroflexota bacterium]